MQKYLIYDPILIKSSQIGDMQMDISLDLENSVYFICITYLH